ncbi:MAG: hypothetical protein Q9O62_04850 [Ardenticatenia bacterium]|nr:hypothetical protein [Ardenticatenia bacterium]
MGSRVDWHWSAGRAHGVHGRPLFRLGRQPTEAESWLSQEGAADELAELLFQRDALLAALHDLQMDLQMGKIGEEDFRRLDALYRARAVEVLRRLDELQEEDAGSATSASAAEHTWEAWIERAVERARQATSSSTPT